MNPIESGYRQNFQQGKNRNPNARLNDQPNSQASNTSRRASAAPGAGVVGFTGNGQPIAQATTSNAARIREAQANRFIQKKQNDFNYEESRKNSIRAVNDERRGDAAAKQTANYKLADLNMEKNAKLASKKRKSKYAGMNEENGQKAYNADIEDDRETLANRAAEKDLGKVVPAVTSHADKLKQEQAALPNAAIQGVQAGLGVMQAGLGGGGVQPRAVANQWPAPAAPNPFAAPAAERASFSSPADVNAQGDAQDAARKAEFEANQARYNEMFPPKAPNPATAVAAPAPAPAPAPVAMPTATQAPAPAAGVQPQGDAQDAARKAEFEANLARSKELLSPTQPPAGGQGGVGAPGAAGLPGAAPPATPAPVPVAQPALALPIAPPVAAPVAQPVPAVSPEMKRYNEMAPDKRAEVDREANKIEDAIAEARRPATPEELVNVDPYSEQNIDRRRKSTNPEISGTERDTDELNSRLDVSNRATREGKSPEELINRTRVTSANKKITAQADGDRKYVKENFKSGGTFKTKPKAFDPDENKRKSDELEADLKGIEEDRAAIKSAARRGTTPAAERAAKAGAEAEERDFQRAKEIETIKAGPAREKAEAEEINTHSKRHGEALSTELEQTNLALKAETDTASENYKTLQKKANWLASRKAGIAKMRRFRSQQEAKDAGIKPGDWVLIDGVAYDGYGNEPPK